MILQALLDYYEELAARKVLGRPGWSKAKVSWALEINEDGSLQMIHPLREKSGDGKRMLPMIMEMPAQVKRSSGVAANFLCDNSSYILGEDTKGKPERTESCFEAARKKHQDILKNTESKAAKAVLRFFETWNDDIRNGNQEYQAYKDELMAGDNITMIFGGRYISEYPEVREAWQKYYDNEEKGGKQFCLITGKQAVPQLVHPSIKNVRDAQSSGAALVSFNAQAFCSYGKEQNENAPAGKYAAFAYTNALNYLLSDKEHVKYVGNAAVVYWAKDAVNQYQDIFAALLEGTGDQISERDLNGIIGAISQGIEYDYSGIPLDPENEFFVLGISPNAARLSVRFFYHTHFGEIVRNIKKHYDDIQIIPDHRDSRSGIPLWSLLRETINVKSNDKTPIPQMAGDVMKSMISGGRYPETLMNQTMLRIRAEHDITRGKAAIIKGYLIRNTANLPDSELFKEVSTVSLNEDSTFIPYVLGRLFSVLESIQQSANPGINATIKDRFFNSACATPGTVFPILLKLSNSHLKKLEKGKAVYWERQILEILNRVGNGFPGHLSLQEQGAFILGYYHQTQKRFEKKTEDKEEQ